MNDRVAIITDSIACLPQGLIDRHRIKIVPYSFYFEGKVYKDWQDITPSEAYELFLKDPESFLSSPASPVEYLKAYRELSQYAQNIICVTLSSKLSTAYNVALMAKKQAESEFPQTSIEVLDSQTVSAAEGFVVLAAARAVEEGKSLPEVVKAAEAMRSKVSLVAILDTIRYVYRSGRVPKLAARAGSVLNIKPMFTVSSGLVRVVGLTRNKDHSINQLLEAVRKKVGQSSVYVAVMHAYALDEAEKLKERVSSEFNCVELWLTEFSPLLGYACGTGTLGLAFYEGD